MTKGEGQAPDDEVLELLRRALLEDEVPADVVRAAKAAWTWRTIDAELAALTYDSVLDDDVLAGVRGLGTARSLAFEGGGMLIEVEVTEDGERRELIGQVAPPGTATVVVEGADGRPALILAADQLGRFHAERLADGIIRLRVDRDGDALVTAWLAL